MKKIILFLPIFILIVATTITKSSTKGLDKAIFQIKENLRAFSSEFEKIKLEHDYLSSAERLLEYQSQYFEDELIQKNIEIIKVFKIKIRDKKIQNFKITKE